MYTLLYTICCTIWNLNYHLLPTSTITAAYCIIGRFHSYRIFTVKSSRGCITAGLQYSLIESVS